jgi:hypothetical protein
MRFYDVPVNRSVPTEANRGLTSYRKQREHIQKPLEIYIASEHKKQLGIGFAASGS